MEKEVMDDVIEAAMAEAMAEAETEALNFKASAMVLSPEDMSHVVMSPMAMSQSRYPTGVHPWGLLRGSARVRGMLKLPM